MSHDQVRKGITTANFNAQQSGILSTEIIIISIGVGLYAQSWLIFGFTFFALIGALFIPAIAGPFMITLSVLWGVIGYGIGAIFDSTGASIVLGAIGLLAGLGVHFSALQWTRDISS